MIRKTLAGAAALAVVAGSLLFATLAGAGGGDRNRDGLPDRWERAHGLSLKVKQARRDQDRDGLNNRGEYRSGLDPLDDDSDDDGVEDGDENAGTIASFSGGALTITLAKGGTLTAAVDEDTEIECEGAGASSAGGDDGNDDDQRGDDDQQGDGDHDDGDHDDGEHGDGEHGDDDDCGADPLSPGREVEEAELKTRGGEAVWEEIELQ